MCVCNRKVCQYIGKNTPAALSSCFFLPFPLPHDPFLLITESIRSLLRRQSIFAAFLIRSTVHNTYTVRAFPLPSPAEKTQHTQIYTKIESFIKTRTLTLVTTTGAHAARLKRCMHQTIRPSAVSWTASFVTNAIQSYRGQDVRVAK